MLSSTSGTPFLPIGCDRRSALQRMTAAFRAAGLETPALDARRLLASVLGVSSAALLAGADEPIGDIESALSAMVARRLVGEPVSRILGYRECYGRRFLLSPETLDPRPETETSIEVALSFCRRTREPGAPLRILDIGTGTGCILVTLLAELPQATGVGTDICAGALSIARQNARAHGVADRSRWCLADGPEPLSGPFELVVSNPPYIRTEEIEELSPDVRLFDPHVALDGGSDGLDHYRRITAAASRLVAGGGMLVLEVGFGQADTVSSMLATALPGGVVTVTTDLAGVLRCVAAWT